MYTVHVQQTNVIGIVFCNRMWPIPVEHSTRGVHLIKDLNIAIANKPLQICFQLTVIPKRSGYYRNLGSLRAGTRHHG